MCATAANVIEPILSALPLMAAEAKSGAVTFVQRTASDLRPNPHLHVMFLDGTYHEHQTERPRLSRSMLSTHDIARQPRPLYSRGSRSIAQKPALGANV
jgi:hypothetical protein